MSKTRLDLIQQCLTNLGILAEGQSLADNDQTKMDTIIDPAVAMLSALDIFTFTDVGEIGPSGGDIDDAAFLPLADYVANKACAAFNLPADTKLQTLSMLAEASLRTLGAPPRTLRNLRVDPAVRRPRAGYYRGGF